MKGILFAFHGCLQSVTQFGFASTACPTCHGTPNTHARNRILLDFQPRVERKMRCDVEFQAKTYICADTLKLLRLPYEIMQVGALGMPRLLP